MPEQRGLRGLQRAVLDGVLAGREVLPASIRGLLRAPAQGSIEARWHIYATGLLARAVESIENDYPAVARVLGPPALGSLVARYVRRHAPRSYDIGRLGARLPRFLESDALTETLPFLPDLARLEWALAEAFVSRDVESLSWGDLARLPADDVADLRLALRPGATLLRSEWPVLEVWRCRERAACEIDVAMERRGRAVLVSRNRLSMLCREADPAEQAVFHLAAIGGRLADAEPEDADAVVATFRRLVEDGVLALSGGGPPPARDSNLRP